MIFSLTGTLQMVLPFTKSRYCFFLTELRFSVVQRSEALIHLNPLSHPSSSFLLKLLYLEEVVPSEGYRRGEETE